MVERRRILGRLPLGRTLLLALVGLTLALGAIAAVAIGNLYQARQRYEDTLARTYALEVAGSRLVAAGVAEQAAERRTGPGARAARRRAAAVFDAEARRARGPAARDPRSAALLRRVVAAEGAMRRGGDSAPVRAASEALAARQAARRRDARERARDDSRHALAIAAVTGGLALLVALLLVAGLIASIRRPLEDLVGATRRLAAGDLGERVRPRGPEELSDLGSAFNAMAEQLGEAQTRIEFERAKLATTIESLGDALVVCDPGGTITAVNPRAAEVVPMLVPGGRADGKDSPLPPLEQALVAEAIREAGDLTVSVTAALLGREEGVVWTIRDVSERARLERVKSDFVATASHELRSPLTSIKGFVELLARSEDLGPREREFVDVILQSTDRLVDLVNDLLDVARLEAGRMEVRPRLFDLQEVVREVTLLMQPRVDAKGQRLNVHLPSGIPRALADPVRVRQIATNLLTNAHQYTAEAGRLAVSVGADEGTLVLTVADTGRGMSEEELERVFDRFVRRADGSGGTGLGLAIVKSLVELQGGSIEVDSEVGEGTVFTVRLPAEPLARPLPADSREALLGKRVLVVDDEPHVAAAISQQLRLFGVAAETAHSGDEAIDRLRDDQFDAMTLDILMPGRSGIDVLRTLRADPELNETPVVVVSVLSGERALLGEWKVAKPVDAEELADVLGSAFSSGRTRVLVVGRSAVRPRLEPALVRLGLDHEWVTSGAAAARACDRRRYELALVDAGMRNPHAVLKALDLRGRRPGRSVVLFSAGDDVVGGAANLGSEPVPLEEAAGTVLQALVGAPQT
jgi:signal transduction histidine kinase/DNA-binding response OmpR family regulator